MDNLGTEAAAEYTGVPASTLRYWRSTRNPDAPASFQIGRRVFYRRADLEAWVQAQYNRTVVGRSA
jgi:predicted DNA-binding transcriptional regulator AlpA